MKTSALVASLALGSNVAAMMQPRNFNSNRRSGKPCPPISGDFTINQYQLYPENADWDSNSCLLYLSSLFNGTVAVFNPYTAEIVRILSFPGISHNPANHASGVDFDARTGLFSFVADNAVAFSTGGQDVSGPNFALLYDPVKNTVLYNVNLTAVAGGTFSGYQDLDQDPRGNVYLVGTYSSSIIKISPNGKDAKVWYLQLPVNTTRTGLSGIATTGDIMLAADNDGGKIVRFDTTQSRGVPVTIPVTPPTTLGGTDAVYLPPMYNGTVLLVAVDTEGVAVFVSKDGKWTKAAYKGMVPLVTTGDSAGSSVTAVVQIAQSIYTVQEFFEAPLPGSLAGGRSKFPMIDITKQVDALVKK